MKIIFLTPFLLLAVGIGFGQEVNITHQEYRSALSNGHRNSDKLPRKSTTTEESFADGKTRGYEKHITENLPPDRSRYINESEFRGKREVRQIIKIGDVSYCKEGDGKWEETNCDRITSFSGNNVLNSEWHRSVVHFETESVTQFRSKITYAVPRSGVSKQMPVLFIEHRTTIDKEGKIVLEESVTGVVGSDEILRRSTTNFEYGLTDLRIEAPIP